MSWSTSELWVRLVPLNRFKPSSKLFYWPFQGGTSFVDLLCFCSVFCLICLCARLFICALWSPYGKGLTSWLSFVVSNCEFVTFPLLSWVRCGTWLYRFLIFAPLLTLISVSHFLFPYFCFHSCLLFLPILAICLSLSLSFMSCICKEMSSIWHASVKNCERLHHFEIHRWINYLLSIVWIKCSKMR